MVFLVILLLLYIKINTFISITRALMLSKIDYGLPIYLYTKSPTTLSRSCSSMRSPPLPLAAYSEKRRRSDRILE